MKYLLKNYIVENSHKDKANYFMILLLLSIFYNFYTLCNKKS